MQKRTDRSDRGIKADAGSRAAGNTEIGRTTVINKKRVKPLLLYIGKIQSRGMEYR